MSAIYKCVESKLCVYEEKDRCSLLCLATCNLFQHNALPLDDDDDDDDDSFIFFIL